MRSRGNKNTASCHMYRLQNIHLFIYVNSFNGQQGTRLENRRAKSSTVVQNLQSKDSRQARLHSHFPLQHWGGNSVGLI